MADFTGLRVTLTLKNPPSLVLQGKVMHVVAGQTLTLQDVFFPANGSRAPTWTVRATDVQDLKVDADPESTAATRTTAPPVPSAPPQARPPSNGGAANVLPVRTTPAPTHAQRQPSDFVDPAILSYGRSPAPSKTAAKPAEPSTPVKSMLAKAAENLPSNSSPFIGDAGKSSSSRKPSTVKNGQKQGVEGRQATTAHGIPGDGTQEAGQADTSSKRKVKKGQKKKAANGTQDPPPVMNIEVSRNGNDMNGNVKRGKGWRQTPLLQPSPQSTSSPQPGSKKKSRREREQDREASQNGWATEDATDIQEMEEFDFEANHKLFDKKTVFDQLRQGDTTADEDRLVGHNKLARPGTYGGKNLHPTENVLSPQLGPKYNSNELDSTSDADTELNFMGDGGRSSSRHSTTRTGAKKQPSRQNSNQVDPRPHPLSASMSSERGMSRSRTSLPGRTGKAMHSLTTSPMPERTQSPMSALSATRTHAPSTMSSRLREAHLAIHPTMTPCPVLHPSAFETLEKETVSRYGLTSEAITESAARCIGETAMDLFHSTTSSRRPSRTNTLRGSMSSHLPTFHHPTTPHTVVVIAGNHTTGARAVAAARHLLARNTHIILAEAQYESSESQSPQMKTQTAILKRMAKAGAPIRRGPWRRAEKYIKNLPSPPALIIDALLAGNTYESLAEETSNSKHAADAQREAREMIDWANRSRAPVLSVGCPSGVSGLDGSTTVMEGEPLAVRPGKVLALGVPLQGMLEALKGGERWEVCVGDLGVNIALRREEGVGFRGQWVVEVRYLEEEGEGVV
ncbi:enhancer of mRNA decapping [Saxophila tyrrhenica]|uniref:Enhancer of mRNA-decapping protein 3 n=1 Tax=Saxophila tyrrhenica TaxID=1690608 RepID=A0AAV9P5E5_9PEZI|nr:enhancer of mRNA decapping [Saxophila tyrrhenica]